MGAKCIQISINSIYIYLRLQKHKQMITKITEDVKVKL